MKLKSSTCMSWLEVTIEKCGLQHQRKEVGTERGNTTQEENERAKEEGVRFSQPVVSGRQECRQSCPVCLG